MNIKSGDIFYAKLDPVIGSEQSGIRPVIVIQNNIGNKFSPTVVVIPITSNINKSNLPTHVKLLNTKLSKKSIALIEQIRTLDKTRLINKVTCVDQEDLKRIKTAIKKNLNIRWIELI